MNICRHASTLEHLLLEKLFFFLFIFKSLWKRTSWLGKSDGFGLDSEAFCAIACNLLSLGSSVLSAVLVGVKRKHTTLCQ